MGNSSRPIQAVVWRRSQLRQRRRIARGTNGGDVNIGCARLTMMFRGDRRANDSIASRAAVIECWPRGATAKRSRCGSWSRS